MAKLRATPFLPITRSVGIAGPVRPRLVIGVAAIGVIAAATAWQWTWLAAIGVAPLLVSVAPCALMCGLGLCMHRMGGSACGPGAQDGQVARDPADTPPASREA